MEDYERYYESMRGQYGQDDTTNPPGRKGKLKVFISFVCVALVFLIIGMLLMGILQSMRNPWLRYEFALPDLSDSMPKMPSLASPSPSPSPTPRPVALDRPMIDLDGVAPMLPDAGNPLPDMIDEVAPSVVGVLNYSKEPINSKKTYTDDAMGKAQKKEDSLQGMGTGFVISSDGYIVTNAHVVLEAYEIAVEFIDGSEIKAELIGLDVASDVAVLKVSRPGVKPLKLGDSGNIRVGDYAVAVGNPLGRGLEGTVTLGIISARSRAVSIDGQSNMYIQTDAAINLGNSGGPLLNMRGEVIGINTAKTISAGVDEYGTLISAEGLGFALPINTVQIIIEKLITAGYVQRAALGVTIRHLTRAELDEMGLSNGINVQAVSPGSPAEGAGIKAKDIILSCDGKVYNEQTELVEYISMQKIGTIIELCVYREGEEITISVALADKDNITYEDLIADFDESVE